VNHLTMAGVPKIDGVQFVDVTPQQITIMSLDERFSEAFLTLSSTTAAQYNAIMSKMQDVTNLSAPAELFQLQVHLADYSLKLETISALTHKGVNAIEALLKT
jgi:type III secretion system protein